MIADSTQFTLKFGSEENDINATTYGVILVNTVTLLEETNKVLQTGAHLEIKVKSERKGSFLVDLGIDPVIVATIAPLMTQQNIETVKNVANKIIETASSAYELWKKLKGEKPKEIKEDGKTVVIITGDGNEIQIDNSVKNLVLEKRVQDAFINTFAALAKDNNVSDFAVLDENKEVLFKAERKDFPLLTKKVATEQPEKQTHTETIHLNIKRQSFDQALKSDYLYRGISITANITDKKFWEAVDRGERYGKGDILFAELEIEQEFNKSLNAYENKSYTITQVIQHIPRETQVELFEG